MNKIALLIFSIIFCINATANAESRFITVQQGIPGLYTNINTPVFAAYTSCDPFIMKVEGVKYYMILKTSGKYTYNNLLGCNGRKYSLFQPLTDLKTSGDAAKLTGEELETAGIRFVKLKNNGYLDIENPDSDYDIKKISYIDLTRLRISTAPRPYGSFDVYIKKDNGNLKKVISTVTIHTLHYAQSLFKT